MPLAHNALPGDLLHQPQLLKDGLRNGDAAKKVAQQFKIAKRGQIHERAAV